MGITNFHVALRLFRYYAVPLPMVHLGKRDINFVLKDRSLMNSAPGTFLKVRRKTIKTVRTLRSQTSLFYIVFADRGRTATRRMDRARESFCVGGAGAWKGRGGSRV